MTDDLEMKAVRQAARTLVVQRKAAETEYQYALASDDDEMLAKAMTDIAEIDAKGEALNKLYTSEMARRNPPAQVPETEGEFQNRAPERMNYNDTLRIMSKSKYNLPPDQEAENLRRGIAELRRRKASGDLQT